VPAIDKSHAVDHVVVVLFENRSLDNVLGHLYGPDDGKTHKQHSPPNSSSRSSGTSPDTSSHA
jgi:phospholipase C